MGKLFNELKHDILYEHGMNACLKCGVCTAVCPAVEFYDYSPREVMNLVELEDDQLLESLLKSDPIWYWGQCFSCRTPCPWGNSTAAVILNMIGYFRLSLFFFLCIIPTKETDFFSKLYLDVFPHI